MTPKSVNIGIFCYSVKEVKGPICVDRRECRGSIDYEELSIEILENLPRQRKQQTLLHEIIHGVLNERSISSSTDEETLVDELAKGFLCVVQSNPELIKFLIE